MNEMAYELHEKRLAGYILDFPQMIILNLSSNVMFTEMLPVPLGLGAIELCFLCNILLTLLLKCSLHRYF